MRPAANLPNPAGRVERVVAGVRIGLEIPRKRREKRLRTVPLVRRRRVKHHLPADGIQVGPQAPFSTAAGGLQDRHRRIVGLQIRRGGHVATQLVADRR